MLPEPANPLEVRMARLEGSYEQIDKRLDRVETNLARLEDKMETRFGQVEANINRLEDKMEARFNQVESRFSQVDTKMDGLRTLIFLLFGALAGLVTVFEFIR